MEISLLTPKCTLVPADFFEPARVRDLLSAVCSLNGDEDVRYVEIPQYAAWLVYCDDRQSAAISENEVSGGEEPLPDLFYILQALPGCPEYNKILCAWRGGYVFLGIAQGKTLLLANAYPAQDFLTAEYYIFRALESLQLNPEVSTICWRAGLGADEEMSLYRYFKAVERL
ncbi:MAG: DUF3822 family protein [Bacteroidales bacterium]|nr:DUF3822 family protein [Bacteroidales bacterium]